MSVGQQRGPGFGQPRVWKIIRQLKCRRLWRGLMCSLNSRPGALIKRANGRGSCRRRGGEEKKVDRPNGSADGLLRDGRPAAETTYLS